MAKPGLYWAWLDLSVTRVDLACYDTALLLFLIHFVIASARRHTLIGGQPSTCNLVADRVEAKSRRRIHETHL